jgi:hypothetical protein
MNAVNSALKAKLVQPNTCTNILDHSTSKTSPLVPLTKKNSPSSSLSIRPYCTPPEPPSGSSI